MSLEKTEVKYKGNVVWCYGDIQEDSNFDVVSNNEFEDGIVADVEGLPTWEEVVIHLVDCGKFTSGIQQVEAV